MGQLRHTRADHESTTSGRSRCSGAERDCKRYSISLRARRYEYLRAGLRKRSVPFQPDRRERVFAFSCHYVENWCKCTDV